MPSFADLADAFLREELDNSPVRGTALGLTEYDDRLDDLSEAAITRQIQRDAHWLETFRALTDDELSDDERIDRDLVVSTLRGRQIVEDFLMWRRQPDTYLNPGMQGIFLLFLHQLRPVEELVDAAISRMSQIPDNLADGERNLDPSLVPPIFLERAANQARAGARYVREILPSQVEDPKLRDRIAEQGERTAQAYEAYVAFLEDMRPIASGEWALGEARYSALLQEKELLGFDARELRERGRAAYDELAAELTRCARELKGTDDWKQVLDELNEDHPRTPEQMRIGYEEWTERARQFLKDHRLVSFPEGEECLVVPSPHFQRPVLAVASYMTPPQFTDRMRGHFFVPFPPDGASEEEVQKRLASNSYPGIPTTAVHEAYPGHHWHAVMSKSNPSKLRRAYRTPYFNEGWALYAERMMREQGFFTDLRHEMNQYEATIFRAARIIVDTSLHMGEMTWDEAVDFMVGHTGLTEPTAKAEVTRYCAWPTQASSYLTGCLEIVRIREAFFARRGSSDTDALRAFHDTITSSGGLPIALAERAVLAAA
ncbi:MAG TPA: DUF885 domain-containing protein [Candidatus Limnocylindria bacterium]|nr:DUF885 domain-containing protein [Candidatus Limnocylindria bacterium]